MKQEVAEAIKEIERGSVGGTVSWEPDEDGGAYVRVDDVALGQSFSPSRTWIAFHITWAYPDADCYPHFIASEIRYVGKGPSPNEHPGGNLPTSMTRDAVVPGSNTPAIQVSRRSNHRNADTDSALQKLLRVVEFLRSR
jgi:hypothetical protein